MIQDSVRAGRPLLVGIALACALASAAPEQVRTVAVTPQEAADWVDCCIPLPHEIAVTNKAVLPAHEIEILLHGNATETEKQAVTDFKAAWKERAGAEPAGSRFQILVGVLDGEGKLEGVPVPDAARLRQLPDNEQAYLIRPVGPDRLVVTALTEKGVYYGVQTLRQMLEPRLSRDSVEIPLAAVTDWPDMRVRGFWNCPFGLTAWNAKLKLNHITNWTGYDIPKDRPIRLTDPGGLAEWMREARLHAAIPLVRVTHLNYWYGRDRTGVAAIYPDVVGKGEKAIVPGEVFKKAGRDIPVICATNPVWPRLVAELLDAFGKAGVKETSIWLSEFEGQCQCEECLKSTTQVESETKIVLDAWKQVREKYPDMTIRIFFSQGGSGPETVRALASLPPEIRIERVYGMTKPFWDAAAQDRWVLDYSGPYFTAQPGMRLIAAPHRTALEKAYAGKLKGEMGLAFAAPDHQYTEIGNFIISAVAEWSWNVSGRNLRQFARAWATRQGYVPAENAAQAIELVEPVESAIFERCRYEQRLLTHEYVAQDLRAGKPFGGTFPTARLDGWMDDCGRALALAETLNKPDLAYEIRYVLAFLKVNRSLDNLYETMSRESSGEPAVRQAVRERLMEYEHSVSMLTEMMTRITREWKAIPEDAAEKIRTGHNERWKKAARDIREAVLTAQAGGTAAGTVGIPDVTVPSVAGSIRTDGVPDEESWKTAGRTRGFLRAGGKSAVMNTEVLVCRDRENLYVAFICSDPSPADIWKNAKKESEVFEDDCVAVLLQPDRKSETHFQFALSVSGARFDQKADDILRDTEGYNPRWTAAVKVTATGWTAEMAIPFEALGAAPAAGATWGADFGRRTRDNEISSWTGSNRWHTVFHYGILRFWPAGADLGMKTGGEP